MTVLSSLTAALERCWTAIRVVCPDAREAAIVVYLHPRGDRRGHYSPNAWTTRSNGHLDEVHVSSHILAEGAESVFQTLLHEAVHSLATTRKVQDCSRQGRYHNAAFAQLAGSVGLTLAKDARIGTITTGLTPHCKVQYKNTIADLAGTLDLWQALARTLPPVPGTKPVGSVKLACPSCLRILRASQKTLDQGPILCVPCAVEFVADTPSTQGLAH